LPGASSPPPRPAPSAGVVIAVNVRINNNGLITTLTLELMRAYQRRLTEDIHGQARSLAGMTAGTIPATLAGLGNGRRGPCGLPDRGTPLGACHGSIAASVAPGVHPLPAPPRPAPLHVFALPAAIRRDYLQQLPMRRAHDHAYCRCHASSLARRWAVVNRQNPSEHWLFSSTVGSPRTPRKYLEHLLRARL
jgi:hypothetical protein